MPKVQRFTAMILAIFLVVMLFIIIVGIDFNEDDSFEKMYDDNGGMLWGCMAIIGIAIFVMQFTNGIYISEVKKWLKVIIQKDTIIEAQNESIKEQKKSIILIQQEAVNLQKEAVVLQKESVVTQKKHVEEYETITKLLIIHTQKENENEIKHIAFEDITTKKMNTMNKRMNGIQKKVYSHGELLKKITDKSIVK